MWEYISKLGKTIKKYRTEIAIGAASTILPVSAGCAEAWQESYRELAKINDGTSTQSTSTFGSDDSYWRMQHSIEELKRIEKEEALSGARIRANTRRMLYEMELKRKLEELKKPK